MLPPRVRVSRHVCARWQDDDYRDESIYALTISLLSILVALIFLIMQKMTGDENVCNKVKVPVFIFFVVAWMILANLVTFRGPFEIPGNGYFAAWAGAHRSLHTRAGAMRRHVEQV